MSSKTQSARLHTAGRFALANPRSVSSVALTETRTSIDPAVLAVAPGASISLTGSPRLRRSSRMIRLMAAATARDLHEAQLACTMHADENLHGEDSPQEPGPWVPRRTRFLVFLLAEELALHRSFGTILLMQAATPRKRSSA